MTTRMPKHPREVEKTAECTNCGAPRPNDAYHKGLAARGIPDLCTECFLAAAGIPVDPESDAHRDGSSPLSVTLSEAEIDWFGEGAT